MVLLLIRDLMFGSKIDGLLASRGVTSKKMRDSSDLSALADPGIFNFAVLNLGIPGDEPFVALEALLKLGIRVLCYFPHVEVGLAARAASLGGQEIYPRGAILGAIDKAISVD